MSELITTKKEIIKRRDLVEKIVIELQELGLIDYDEKEEEAEECLPPITPAIPPVSSGRMLAILKGLINYNLYSLNEVSTTIHALRGFSVTTEQVRVITRSFRYSFSSESFILEVFPQISDPENLETVVKEIFYFSDKTDIFMRKIRACYPDSVYAREYEHEKDGPLPSSPERESEEQESIYTITIRETLTPLAKAGLVSIPLLIISNIIFLIILLF